MSYVRTGSAFLGAILAAMILPCAEIPQMHAQMQQTGTADSTSTNSSRTDATSTSAAASPADSSGGASSWTAGKGSFGITAKTPAGSSVGATGGKLDGRGR